MDEKCPICGEGWMTAEWTRLSTTREFKCKNDHVWNGTDTRLATVTAERDEYAEALRNMKGRLVREDPTGGPLIPNAVFGPLIMVCPVCEEESCSPSCTKVKAEAALKGGG